MASLTNTQDNKTNTHPKADGSRKDHWRDFRMCERWMG